VATDARRKILLDYSRNHGRRADRNHCGYWEMKESRFHEEMLTANTDEEVDEYICPK